MNLSSHASVWKPAHEKDAARETSAPTGTPIGVTRLLSLGQNATIGWKQKQHNLHQQQHQQPKYRLQQSDFPLPTAHWRSGVNSPSTKHHFQQSKSNRNHISNDTTTSGRSYQRDVPQHSRGGTWTDNHSRSSHTSTSTGTTSCKGTSSLHGTGTHLLGDLGKMSIEGGHESSQHPYYNAMSLGHPPRKEQYAPTPTPTPHPYSISAAGVATMQQIRAGSGFTGGGANTQYGWSPQQQHSSLKPSTLEMDGSSLRTASTATSRTADLHPIVPQVLQTNKDDKDDDNNAIEATEDDTQGSPESRDKKWLLRMNRELAEIPVGELDLATMPLSAVMNRWAKTKSSQGASMVEMWLKRAQQEYDAGNHRVEPTAKMYTTAGTWLS
jgi:hypothetical protein